MRAESFVKNLTDTAFSMSIECFTGKRHSLYYSYVMVPFGPACKLSFCVSWIRGYVGPVYRSGLIIIIKMEARADQ